MRASGLRATYARTILAASAIVLVMPRDWSRADEGLAARIEAVIRRPEYRQAHWGILVLDTESGNTVYALNPDHLFFPASTTKLYSCSAALAAFGADYRFETPVYRRGALKDGRLAGDLILVAQGDLTFGGRTAKNGHLAFKDHDHIYANGNTRAELTDTDPLAGLNALARQVHEAGIKAVAGDVLIDDRLFARSKGSGSGPDVLSPILVNDNLVDILISPATAAGQPASVRVRPESVVVTVDAQVETVARGKPTSVHVSGSSTRSLVVRGQIPLGARPLVRIHPVEDPAAFARALFIEALRRAGVSVSASPLQEPAAQLPPRGSYGRLPRVACFTSPPFSEVIKVTLKVSHNLYASTLPLLLATREGKRTLADGLHAERKFLEGLGVEVGTISFGGGAGGSNADAVTPRASVRLLRALSKRPDFPVLADSLPVLGRDGTLVDAVPSSSPARGQVRAKTGTLEWSDVMNDRLLLTSKALAGVMTSAKGRALTLAIYVNNVPLPRGVGASREGKTLGQICEIIYQHAP